MAKIVWTDQSVLELKDILDYISKDSKQYAENQIRRINLSIYFVEKDVNWDK
jgi:plasmid stabilization system protein ParE